MDSKVVFFGTPDFAAYALAQMVEAGVRVVAVVTMPDKPVGRGHKLTSSAVKKKALDLQLPVLQPESLKDPEFIARLEALKADIFVVVAFRMLPQVVWGMPPLGTFNLHASLLPAYRGAAPIQHAILNGEVRTGVTTFFLNERIDEGAIIFREEVEISARETAGTLHDKLMLLGANLIVQTIQSIEAGNVRDGKPQPVDIGAIPLAPKIFKEDRMLSFASMSAVDVDRRVRAMSPYPAALATLVQADGREIEVKILSVWPKDLGQALEPGECRVVSGGRVFVGTTIGCVEIETIQFPSKKAVTARDAVNGSLLSDSVRFL